MTRYAFQRRLGLPVANSQIDELHELLEPSYSAGEYLSPDSSRPNNHYNNDCFLFGFNSVAHTLANYHPSATQISVLWHKYQQNVAPLVMVLHQEAVNLAFQCYQVCPEVLDEVSECMLFAVYFSAAASMSEEECLVEFEDSKEAATSHFRFAIEQGFVKAGLTTAKNLNLLQAAVLYLKSLRGLGETRFAWTMTSLVVRLATGLGLHRDGSTFGLEPFEVEMRRRLWWCICILDVETAEDQGTDPMLHDVFYDTRLPLNINADDIDPFVKDLPQEQSGFTELTYFLLQCEVALATRRLTYHLPGSPCPALQSIEERQSLVEDLDRRLNERYVRHLDPNSALQSVCIKLVRISIAKLSLIIHQPLDKDQKIAHDVRDKIICHAIEMIELSHTLHMDVRLARWKWEFQTHVPWHALAFVLSEMCYSRGNSTLERAWPSISTIFKEWQRDAISQGRTIWQPLSKLMVRATYCRSRQEEKVLTRCVSRPDDSHSHNSPSYDHSAGMFPSLDLPSLDPIFQGSYPSATCMPFDPHPTNSREAEMLGACGISCDSNLLDMPDQQVLQRQLNDVPVSLLTARSVPWLNTGQHQHWDSPDSGLG